MILKQRDDPSKRLRLLEELQRSDRLDNNQRQWLRKQFAMFSKGLNGENNAAYFIDFGFGETKNIAVLHDIRFEHADRSAQIDHLLFDRSGTFFLLEAKAFGGDIHVNERGEFSIDSGEGEVVGIESPFEQSRRHELVLKKVLDDVGIKGRLGAPFKFVHVTLIHPKGIVHRPKELLVDVGHIVKADQFSAWHDRFIDKFPPLDMIPGVLNMRGRETLAEWAEKLVARHRPQDPLSLPDFMRPKPPTTAKLAKRPEQVTTTPVAPVCAECGSALSAKVIQFCIDHRARFDGRQYCFVHQKSFPAK